MGSWKYFIPFVIKQECAFPAPFNLSLTYHVPGAGAEK